MPEVAAPYEEVGALVLSLPAGLRAKRVDGTVDPVVTWNQATGDVTLTPPIGSNSGGGTRIINLSRPVAMASTLAVTGVISGPGSGLTNLAWGALTGKPTTIAGYGITDFNATGDARYLRLAGGTVTGSVTLSTLVFSGGGAPLINAPNGTTTSMFSQFLNAGGNIVFGVDSNVGGMLAIGALPYSTVIANVGAQSLHLATNNTVRLTIDPSGAVALTSALALPGTVVHTIGGASFASRIGTSIQLYSATGGWEIHNAANTVTLVSVSNTGAMTASSTLGVVGLASLGGVQLTAGTGTAAGAIYKHASDGFVLWSVGGSTYDFTLFSPSAARVMVIPQGTIGVMFNGAFGCNGNAPQGKAVSGGTVAGVIAALVANGVLSS